jgi:hypothetical protein
MPAKELFDRKIRKFLIEKEVIVTHTPNEALVWPLARIIHKESGKGTGIWLRIFASTRAVMEILYI